jgi:DNA-binding beta-propeller fold protein YncE
MSGRRPHPISSIARTLIAAALSAPSLVAAQEFGLDPLWKTGGVGSGIGEYGVPESVAIDSLGRVVVTDKGRMMLHVYAADTGAPLFDIGALGSTLGRFDRPNGIAIDASGQVLVVEQRNRRIQILDRTYQPLWSIGGADRFQKPMGIALARNGRIFVTDEARADVQAFDAQGRFLFRFGQDPVLNKVESIELDETGGRIFVCDEGRSRVNIYDMSGVFQGWFGGQGSGPGQFGDDTNAVRLDGRRRIYVNDQGNQRINVFGSDTRFLASFRNNAGGFDSADGLALSEPHNLFLIADQGHNRVVAFDLGEMQCRLERLELSAAAAAPAALAGAFDATPMLPPTPPWADGTLYLEARSAPGDPSRSEHALAHVRSNRDRRGVCVRLVETSAASGVLRGRVELGETTDQARPQLATFAIDAVRAHLAGDASELRFEFAPTAAPRVVALEADRTGREAARAGDRPRLTWRFEDAALRPQTRLEIRVLDANGGLVCARGPIDARTAAFLYDGPALEPGGVYTFQVRAAAGRAWSDWATLDVRRNHPPAALHGATPASATTLRSWPHALEVPIPADAEGDALTCHIELRTTAATVHRTEVLALDAAWRWLPTLRLAENGTLTWRALVSDGLDTVATEWSSLALDARDEDPLPARPQAPAEGAVVHAADLEFEWQPARDPDPYSRLTYDLEWSLDPGFAAAGRQAAGVRETCLWSQPLGDGTVFWRVRATDATGRWALSPVAQFELSRTARVVLRAETATGSLRVELGTRAGASDGLASEDALAAAVVSGVARFTSNSAGLPALARDIRAPRALQALPIVFDLRFDDVAAPWVALHADVLTLPAEWRARLEDSSAPALRALGAPGPAGRIGIDAHGAGRLRLLLCAPESRPTPEEEAPITTAGAPADRPRAARAAAAEAPIALGTRLTLAATGPVVVRIYDARGRVRRLDRTAADGTWAWDGRDHRGARLARGVYWVQARGAGATARRRVVWAG